MNSRNRNFIILAYALSWAIALIFALSGYTLQDAAALPVLLAFMAMPAVAAFIIQRRSGRSLAGMGMRFKFNRWLILAWVLPVIFAVLSLLFSALIPSVSLTNGADFLFNQLNGLNASDADIAELTALMERFGSLFPIVLFFGLLGSSMVAGATVNALAAFGEELGWRGLMQQDAESINFWRHSLVVGIVWGLWHAPIILMGHNYPNNPQLGVVIMTVFTVLLSPMHTLVRAKSGTILAPSIMHGTINALGNVVLVFLSSSDTMLVGITGLGGFAAALLINVGIWVYVRNGGMAVSAEVAPTATGPLIPHAS